MLTTIVIVLFLLVIVYNLAAGLVYMLKDQGKSDRTLRSLTWRIGLSVVLFLLLVLGKMTGILTGNPDPITGQRPAAEQPRDQP
ncbi:MAG: twin transmembrane helix small protein [Xanthomonadales bacterium]|nr:twin transmembrane helix small protein [Xanthomonadales bacterium]